MSILYIVTFELFFGLFFGCWAEQVKFSEKIRTFNILNWALCLKEGSF